MTATALTTDGNLAVGAEVGEDLFGELERGDGILDTEVSRGGGCTGGRKEAELE